MKLKTILLAALAALAVGPMRAYGQAADAGAAPREEGFGSGIAQSVSEQIAALASYSTDIRNLAPGCANPVPAENTCCADGHCGQCSHCCHHMDLWGSAEFLLWWGKGSATPPLVTTSPQGTPQDQAGVLPGAEVLFGGTHLGDEDQAGGRITLGIWLDQQHDVALAGRFYWLGGASDRFFASSDGDPILARPFFNVLLDQNDALLIAFEDLVDGSITASYTNDFLATEAYFQVMLESDRCRRVDAIAGFQFARLDDWLQIDSTHFLREVGDLQLDIRDRFSTHNTFYGGMIGVRAQMMRGCWSLDTLAKIGLGVSQQEVTIVGRTDFTPGPTASGGLLAQDTNIGNYQRDEFGIIPELTINLKYHINPCLSAHVGYTVLFWSDVVTAGSQIDTGVNTTQIPGPIIGAARPAFDFDDEYYWMQGINFGVNWDF